MNNGGCVLSDQEFFAHAREHVKTRPKPPKPRLAAVPKFTPKPEPIINVLPATVTPPHLLKAPKVPKRLKLGNPPPRVKLALDALALDTHDARSIRPVPLSDVCHDMLMTLLWGDAQDHDGCRCELCTWGRLLDLLWEARRVTRVVRKNPIALGVGPA